MRAKSLKIALASIVVICAAIEILLRLFVNFPLYSSDNFVGYWLRPNQKGNYLFLNDWYFNEKSMGVETPFKTSSNFDLLLVGDSVVLGGNPFRQHDKLGPVIQRETRWSVWPVSAGSWALQNELSFLDRNRDLRRNVDAIVFVVNSGDFAQPSSWSSELTHPRSYPASYLWYFVQKFGFGPTDGTTAALRVPQKDVLGMWREFNRSANIPIIVVAYPSPEQAGRNCDWVPREFKAYGQWICYPNSRLASDYRDAMHPSKSGNARLAKFIEGAVEAFGADRPAATGQSSQQSDAGATRATH
jgi:hypothetical protein